MESTFPTAIHTINTRKILVLVLAAYYSKISCHLLLLLRLTIPHRIIITIPPPHQPEQPPEPYTYELSIIQSLQSRTASLRRTFLTLDANGDGCIDRTDLRVALHNVLGVDLTPSQLDGLYARFCYFEQQVDDGQEQEHEEQEQHRVDDGDGGTHYPEGGSRSCSIGTAINKRGVRYHAFVDYITATTAASASHPSSEYGSATLSLRPAAAAALATEAGQDQQI